MAARTTKRRPPKARPVQAPKRQAPTHGERRRPIVRAALITLGLAAAITAAVIVTHRGETPTGTPAQGLPNTPDYHSLSVDPTDADHILLGTHNGLYASADAGKTWQQQALSGQDAMNLARAGGRTLWAAGHNVLTKSTDGGRTWRDVSPAGLPSLDLHGFATDPRNERALFAAVAGRGLYRSTDNGNSFRPLSNDVGGAVMALAVTSSGEILAGDMQRGLLASGDAKKWRLLVRAQIMGLAINPRDPKRILATGPGILLSTDGGRHWRQQLELPAGAGPVAWSTSMPRVAYAVGFDRLLYRSVDNGETWKAVR